MKNVDARGRSCPEPVVMTRSALLEDREGAVVCVDNICAVENITRFAGHQGYTVSREEGEDQWTLTLRRK